MAGLLGAFGQAAFALERCGVCGVCDGTGGSKREPLIYSLALKLCAEYIKCLFY